jgi:hypothetical protein
MTKKISAIVVLFATFCAATAPINAQSMFSRRCQAFRDVRRTCAATIPSRQMEISSRRSRDFVAGFQDNVIYFGGDDGNVYAVDAATERQIWKRATNGPAPATPAIADGTVYIGSYDGKFYAFNAQTGAVKWKFATEGERRFEAKGLHGMQPKNQTIADPFDIFSQVQS